VATQPYLAISDGLTTVEIQSGTASLAAYAMRENAWAPTVAEMLHSRISGYGPYSPVVETLTIEVRGSSIADAYAKLSVLNGLLEQAHRWARGEKVAAVMVNWSPMGSSLSPNSGTPYRDVIIGVGPNNQTSGVRLSAEFDQTFSDYAIRDVTVQFVRRNGAWSIGSVVGSLAAAALPGPLAVTMAQADPFLSPTALQLQLVNHYPGAPYTLNGTLIVAEEAGFNIIDASAAGIYGLSGEWTNPTDAANAAVGGEVWRCTPASTNESDVVNWESAGQQALANTRYGVWAAVRAPTAGVTYTIRCYAFNTIRSIPLKTVTIEGGSSNPVIIYFGTILVRGTVWVPRFTVQVSTLTGSPTCDFNYVALVPLYPSTTVIDLSIPMSASGYDYINVENLLLQRPTPIVSLTTYSGGLGEANTFPVTYYGDPIMITKAATVRVALLAPRANYWRLHNGSTPATMAVSVTRQPMYRVPV